MKKILICLLLLTASAACGQDQKYFGFDLDLLAKATSRWTSYRGQHGERGADTAFAGWLAEQGLSRAAYDQAYSAWWKSFENDPTGKTEARFHTAISKYTQEFEHGDVPDRSAESHGGLTLDRYAQISVALSRQPGADAGKVLKEFGLSGLDAWQKANEAWAAAFKADTSFALSMQYGQLYQKYAGPAFAREQEQKLADSLAGRFDQQPKPSAPPERPTIAQLRAALTSAVQSERWEAARPFAWECDRLGLVAEKTRKSDPRWAHCQPQVLRQEWLPVVLEIVDKVPAEKIQLATGLLDYSEELGFAADVKGAYRRLQERLRVAVAALEKEYAPIQDKAVPERGPLRFKIDEHHSVIAEIERELAGWN